MASIKEEIRQSLSRFGVGVVGFGTIPEDIELHEIEERFPRVIGFGYLLSKSVLATVKDRPTLIYKHHYKTVNWLLDQTSYRLVQFIETRGYRAIAIPASQTVDWEKQEGHVSHKMLAQASGLGWIGKNGLLIHPKFGAHVRYCSVLTDLDFNPDEKVETDCGSCMKCLVACPAKAITENGVDTVLCLEKLKEFSKIRGIGQYICGVCVKVCDGRH